MSTQEQLDDLVADYMNGNQAAFRKIIEAANRPLRGYLAKMGASAALVDEIAQATFVECFLSLDRYEQRGYFMAWLKGIARNLYLQELKAHQKHAKVQSDALYESLCRQRLNCINDHHAQDEASDTAYILEELQSCKEQLPDRSQKILNAYYQEELTLKHLARRFQMKSGHIAVFLSRMRKSLRACMERKGVVT